MNTLLKIGRPTPKSVYSIHNPIGLKLLTRLRLGLSHLNQRIFNHNFQDCVNPLCSCRLLVEFSSHFFLHCYQFRSSHRKSSVRKSVLRNFTKFTRKHLCQSLFIKKETLAQVLSCEFCEISENNFFIEHLWATASIISLTFEKPSSMNCQEYYESIR